MIKLRNFKIGDEDSLWEVFYTSVHMVCSNNYTEEQINAWAPKDLEPRVWISKIRSLKPFVAITNSKIIGYSDVQDDGLIDHFFVHGEFQNRGVGTSLMSEIFNRGARKKILYSEVSHTAKPFFQKHGFKVVKEQTVNIRDVQLSNNLMECRNHHTKCSN
ncbi:MAG: GNAT family N-acetyltransferase [Candidatus Thiodiazotropha sp.]